jgi:hypothetical protein
VTEVSEVLTAFSAGGWRTAIFTMNFIGIRMFKMRVKCSWIQCILKALCDVYMYILCNFVNLIITYILINLNYKMYTYTSFIQSLK